METLPARFVGRFELLRTETYGVAVTSGLIVEGIDVISHLWLYLRQTAFQLTPGLTVLASLTEGRTLIFEENSGRWVEPVLPGSLPMPRLEFGLADPNLPILIDVEVRFDIQLEGRLIHQLQP